MKLLLANTDPICCPRDPDDELIARTVFGEVKYYHFDGLGSTIAITDRWGAVTDRYYDYGAWGEPHPMSVSTTDNPYLYVGQLGYYTHYQDPGLGLLQLGVRYYEPEAGRFTQRDPARRAGDMYLFADNNPALFIDPSGMIAFDWIGGTRECDPCKKKLLESAANRIGKYIRHGCMKKDPPMESCLERKMFAAGEVLRLQCGGPYCTSGRYGYVHPRKGTEIIVICDLAFEGGAPQTSLNFVLLHELVHQCRDVLHRTKKDNKKDEDETNDTVEKCFPGQRP